MRNATRAVLALLLCAGGLLVPGTAVAGPRTAYVVHATGTDPFAPGAVTPIDTLTGRAGAPIAAGVDAYLIAISPDGGTAYVTNYGDDTITPIDTETNTAEPPIAITHPPAYDGVTAIAITPDGRTAYVTALYRNTIVPIDLATRAVGTPIDLGGGLGNGPEALAITPDGKIAYVSDSNFDTVTPVDLVTGIAGSAISLCPSTIRCYESAIAITPNGRTAYVAGRNTGTVTPIDIASNVPGSPISVCSNACLHSSIAIAPNGRTAYAVSPGGVVPIDLATNTPQAGIPVPDAAQIAITPDGKTAYVSGDGGVVPVDLATGTPGMPIQFGLGPYGGVAVTPDQPPIASFTAASARAGSPSAFDASTSSDPDGSVAGYAWDFGDGTGTKSATPEASHDYAGAGIYRVTLTVADNEGCSTAPVFTGQTISCNGSATARSERVVTIAGRERRHRHRHHHRDRGRH